MIRSFIFAFLAMFVTLGPSHSGEIETFSVRRILYLNIDSSINPATLNYLSTAYSKARRDQFQMILINLNTPGGLVTTTKDILTLIGDADFPTVIWIRPEGASATSAGAIIAAGAHVLYMSEGTNIGAATPVQMGGDIDGDRPSKTSEDDSDKSIDDEETKTAERPKSLQEMIRDELGRSNREQPARDSGGSDMRAKAINDLVALVQSLSEARGRNAELFAEMIRTAASYKAREAQENNLIDGLVNTLQELLVDLDGREIMLKGRDLTLEVNNPEVVELKMDLGQQLLNIFANPGLAYILFMIGAALIYLEMQSPGGFIAGSIGALCLILAGIGFQVLPIHFGALGLIVLSFLFFIMEIYVTSYGILSLAGLASLISGSLFLYRGSDGYIEVGHGLIFSTIAAVVVFIGLIAYMFIRDRKKSIKFDFNNPVGHPGLVVAELDSLEAGIKMYQVRVNGEIWRARTRETKAIGDRIVVKAQNTENNTLEF
jgi:membrane-bound serine protease (ClpP class)